MTDNRVVRTAAARMSGLDRPDRFLDDIIIWARGERRNGEPVSAAELARTLIRLASAQKDPAEALATLAASAVQRLVSQR
ncbi:hypothetical protein [Mycobacterium sp.]|uniref:hypothetical protein n=2 Tax=Mycobacterium sp. TaxID=1785 RepID=UPI003F976AD7